MVRVREEVDKVCARNRQGLRKMVVIRRACASVVAHGWEFATALYGMRAEIDDGSVACWAWGWAVVWGAMRKTVCFGRWRSKRTVFRGLGSEKRTFLPVVRVWAFR